MEIKELMDRGFIVLKKDNIQEGISFLEKEIKAFQRILVSLREKGQYLGKGNPHTHTLGDMRVEALEQIVLMQRELDYLRGMIQ